MALTIASPIKESRRRELSLRFQSSFARSASASSMASSGVSEQDIVAANSHGLVEGLLAVDNESQLPLDQEVDCDSGDETDEIEPDDESPKESKSPSRAPSETPTQIITPSQETATAVIQARGIKIYDFAYFPAKPNPKVDPPRRLPPPSRRNIYRDLAEYEYKLRSCSKMSLECWYRSIGSPEVPEPSRATTVSTVPNTPVASRKNSFSEHKQALDAQSLPKDIQTTRFLDTNSTEHDKDNDNDEKSDSEIEDTPMLPPADQNHSMIFTQPTPPPAPAPQPLIRLPTILNPHPPPDDRLFSIPGRILRTLLNLGWVSKEEADARWLDRDWEALKAWDEGSIGQATFEKEYPDAPQLAAHPSYAAQFSDVVLGDGYPWFPEFPIDNPTQWYAENDAYVRRRQTEAHELILKGHFGSPRHRVFRTTHKSGDEDFHYIPGEFPNYDEKGRWIPGYRDRCTFAMTYWVPISIQEMHQKRAVAQSKRMPAKLKAWIDRQQAEWKAMQKVLGVDLDDLREAARGRGIVVDTETVYDVASDPQRWTKSQAQLVVFDQERREGKAQDGGPSQSQPPFGELSQTDSGAEVSQSHPSSGTVPRSRKPRPLIRDIRRQGAAAASFIGDGRQLRRGMDQMHLPPEVFGVHVDNVPAAEDETMAEVDATPEKVDDEPLQPSLPPAAETAKPSTKGKKRSRPDEDESPAAPERPMTRRRKKMMEKSGEGPVRRSERLKNAVPH